MFPYPTKLKRVSPIFSRVSFSSRRQSRRTFCDSECSSSCRGKFVARCRKHAMLQFWAIITGFLRHYTAKILIILSWLARQAKPRSWPRGKWKRFQLWYKRLKINLNLKNWTEEIKPTAHSLHSGTRHVLQLSQYVITFQYFIRLYGRTNHRGGLLIILVIYAKKEKKISRKKWNYCLLPINIHPSLKTSIIETIFSLK